MIYNFILDLFDALDKFIITMKMPHLIEDDEQQE
jgi:hypothetical protein